MLYAWQEAGTFIDRHRGAYQFIPSADVPQEVAYREALELARNGAALIVANLAITRFESSKWSAHKDPIWITEPCTYAGSGVIRGVDVTNRAEHAIPSIRNQEDLYNLLSIGGLSMKKSFKKELVTEESKIQEQWYKEAHDMTPEKLEEFVTKLTEKYIHDYGTVCHAVAAAALGAAHAVGKKEGITGFQAGCIMWSFIQEWMHIEGPAKLIQYEDMMYPQYEEKFDKRITKETHEWLIENAKKRLRDAAATKDMMASSSVIEHWEKIASGWVPFGFRVDED